MCNFQSPPPSVCFEGQRGECADGCPPPPLAVAPLELSWRHYLLKVLENTVAPTEALSEITLPSGPCSALESAAALF